jgi:hypothetical protein
MADVAAGSDVITRLVAEGQLIGQTPDGAPGR